MHASYSDGNGPKDLCTFQIWSRLQSTGVMCSTSFSKLMPHIHPTVLSAAADVPKLTFVAEHHALLGRTKSLKVEARIYFFSSLNAASTLQRCQAVHTTCCLSADSITRHKSTQGLTLIEAAAGKLGICQKSMCSAIDGQCMWGYRCAAISALILFYGATNTSHQVPATWLTECVHVHKSS